MTAFPENPELMVVYIRYISRRWKTRESKGLNVHHVRV